MCKTNKTSITNQKKHESECLSLFRPMTAELGNFVSPKPRTKSPHICLHALHTPHVYTLPVCIACIYASLWFVEDEKRISVVTANLSGAERGASHLQTVVYRIGSAQDPVFRERQYRPKLERIANKRWKNAE